MSATQLSERRPLRILFLCGADAGRGTLALGLARHLLGDEVQARAATGADRALDLRALQVMDEIGVPVRDLRTQPLETLALDQHDLVVDLCASGGSVVLPAGVVRRAWPLPDPDLGGSGATALEQRLRYRAARDALHAHLLALGREMGVRALVPAALSCPLAAVTGWKNSGKTTLLAALVVELGNRGLRVGTIKATHHDVHPDPPGKDSRRHREAGAVETMLVGPHRWVLTHEGPSDPLGAAARMEGVDLVLVEGLRSATVPKVEVVGAHSDRPILARTDPDVFLVAADVDPGDLAVPVVPRNAVVAVADHLLARLGALRTPAG